MEEIVYYGSLVLELQCCKCENTRVVKRETNALYLFRQHFSSVPLHFLQRSCQA